MAPDSSAYPHVLDTLARVFRALFLYDWPMRPSNLDTAPEAELHKVLHNNFFTEVYVRRPAEEKAIKDKLARQVVVLAGERGSGKSTLLARVSKDLQTKSRRSSARFSVPIVNCNEFPRATYEDEIIDFVYSQVFDALFIATDSPALERRFWSALVMRGTALQAVRDARQAIRGLVSDALTHEAHWATALENHPDVAGQMRDAFHRLHPATRLNELAKSMSALSVSATVIVDNIDHLNDDVQVSIFSSLVAANVQSGQQLVPIIGIRTENYKRARRDLVGSAIIAAEVLTDSTVQMNDHHEAVVTEYLKRRMNMLTRANLPTLFEELDSVEGRRAAQSLGFATGEQLFTELRATADLIRQSPDSVPSRVLSDLDRWCNHSLRDVGVSLANLASLIFPVHRSRIANRKWQARYREMRNVLIRQGILYDKALAMKQPPHVSSLLFESAHQRVGKLYFVDYHLITYLAKYDYPLALSGLAEAFSQYGISRNLISERIRRLSIPRDEDDSGLIRTTDLESSTCEVEIMASGRFLIRYLARTYEYVFWNAAYMPTTEFRLLLTAVATKCRESVGAATGPTRGVSPESIGLAGWAHLFLEEQPWAFPVPRSIWTSSVFRTLVAQTYVITSLAPRYWGMYSQLKSGLKRKYLDDFGARPLPAIILRYCEVYLRELQADSSLSAVEEQLIAMMDVERRTFLTTQ